MHGTPDQNPNITWAAVGKALTAWEEMEEGFARIYCVLKGGPKDFETMKTYIDAAKIFTDRMDEIERAAESYFTSHPDQGREGELAKMVADARLLSKERHRIAHGVVYPLVMHDKPPLFGSDFALHPTWYALERLSRPHSFYVWGSKDIVEQMNKFIALSRQTRDYEARLIASP